MFAGVYPNEVAGLVVVDPTPDFTRTSDDDASDVFVPLGLGQKERDEMRALRKPNPATPKPILAETAMASAMSAAGFPEIQALPPLRDLPVVVLAGYSDTEWPTSMPGSGSVWLVISPFYKPNGWGGGLSDATFLRAIPAWLVSSDP